MTEDVVIVFEAPALDLSVGEEFRRARLSRKLRRAVESRREPSVLHTLVPREPEPYEPPSFERPWPKGCNTCAGLAHRVEGEICPECGLKRLERAG